jgi:hypothetical protein
MCDNGSWLCRVCKRMRTDMVQNTPEIHHTGTIQLQLLHRGTPRWRQTEYHSVILIPGKVLMPALSAGMVQWRRLTTDRVQRFDAGVLAVITSLTGPGQIRVCICATARPWHNMFDRERVRGKPGLTLTVFTTFPGTLGYCLLLSPGKRGFRHTAAYAGPVVASAPRATYAVTGPGQSSFRSGGR